MHATLLLDHYFPPTTAIIGCVNCRPLKFLIDISCRELFTTFSPLMVSSDLRIIVSITERMRSSEKVNYIRQAKSGRENVTKKIKYDYFIYRYL